MAKSFSGRPRDQNAGDMDADRKNQMQAPPQVHDLANAGKAFSALFGRRLHPQYCRASLRFANLSRLST